jgi:hypothetical protein
MTIAKALKRSWALHLKNQIKGRILNDDRAVLVYILTGDVTQLKFPNLYNYES